MARQIVTQAWEQLGREGVTKGLLVPMILEVTAKVGKRLCAAPVAQLYEQQLVRHVGATASWKTRWSPGSKEWTARTVWTPRCMDY